MGLPEITIKLQPMRVTIRRESSQRAGRQQTEEELASPLRSRMRTEGRSLRTAPSCDLHSRLSCRPWSYGRHATYPPHLR